MDSFSPLSYLPFFAFAAARFFGFEAVFFRPGAALAFNLEVWLRTLTALRAERFKLFADFFLVRVAVFDLVAGLAADLLFAFAVDSVFRGFFLAARLAAAGSSERAAPVTSIVAGDSAGAL